MKTYKPDELTYSATARCKCGAGLAYPLDAEESMKLRAWFCADCLLGKVDTATAPKGSHDAYDFMFFSIKGEGQPSVGRYASTRPLEQGVMKYRDHCNCKVCGHAWQGPIYSYWDRNEWPRNVCEICGAADRTEDHVLTSDKVHVRMRERVLVAP